MAWYTTGTIAVSGTTVTGTGTNFLDNTQSIGPGQALLIPGSGTVKMYEVASVQSATKLTLKTSPGTIAAGQAYAILSFYTDSVPDFARRLAAQLSYYQSQMDGWQQIMTGTGSITMTAPDGTSVTISSFSKLTADVASAFLQKGVIATGVDTNSLGSDSFGIWSIGSNAAASNPNLPEANQGVLEVIPGGLYGCTQRFTARYGNLWARTLAATWNASAPTWNPWYLVGDQPVQGYQADANLCVTPGTYSFAASSTNNTPAAVTGILEVKLRLSANSVKQIFTYIGTNATYLNRSWQRTLSGTTWSAWVELVSSNYKGSLSVAGTTTLSSALAQSGGATFYNGDILVDAGEIAAKKVTDAGSGYYNSSFVKAVLQGRGANGDTRGAYAALLCQEQSGVKFSGYVALNGFGSNILFEFRNNGSAYAPTSWISNSDERLKKNIERITDPLEKMTQLKGVTWERLDGMAPGIGFIAQDVQKIFPQAVFVTGDRTLEDGTEVKDVLSPDTNGVAAALHHEAILELMEKIESLEKIIVELQRSLK